MRACIKESSKIRLQRGVISDGVNTERIPFPTVLTSNSRTFSALTSFFCITVNATPLPSESRPSKRCSLPIYVCPRADASSIAQLIAAFAFGVKPLNLNNVSPQIIFMRLPIIILSEVSRDMRIITRNRSWAGDIVWDEITLRRSFFMGCNNNFGGNYFWIIILIIIIFGWGWGGSGFGWGGNNNCCGNDCGCGNACGCGCNNNCCC